MPYNHKIRLCLPHVARTKVTGSRWRSTGTGASYPLETLPLHFMSGPTLWQKNPALEAQQNAIALLHTITSKLTEESSVSVVLPMDSEKGYEER